MKENKTTRIWSSGSRMVISSLVMPPRWKPAWASFGPLPRKSTLRSKSIPLAEGYPNLKRSAGKHGTQIKEIDERTQAALRTTMSQVEAADVKAIAAGQKASEAGMAADKAFASVGDVERRLGSRLENVENYRRVRTVQVGFKPNQTEMDAAATRAARCVG